MTPTGLALARVHVTVALVRLARAVCEIARIRRVVGSVDAIATMFAEEAIWEAVEAAADLLDTLDGVLGCS